MNSLKLRRRAARPALTLWCLAGATVAVAACSSKVGDKGTASGTAAPETSRAVAPEPGPTEEGRGSGTTNSGGEEPAPPTPAPNESHRDGVRNAGESDTDCGGERLDAEGRAPRCAAEQQCRAHADCASDGCNMATGRCAAARSCAQLHGGQTCGKGELGDPNHVHESCCETVGFARPGAQGGAFKLDKYAITAGRFRQFLERTGGNVEAALRANGTYDEWSSRWGAWAAHLPQNMNEAEQLVDGLHHDWEWEHPSHRLPPSNPNYRDYAISAMGCWVGPGSGGGGHSYYLASDGADTFGKDVLDEKILNCVHPFMVDAFCMWDGGEMWDETMVKYAWNGGTGNQRKYPWGNTPVPLTHEDETPADPFHVSAEYLVHGWNYPNPQWEQAYVPDYRDGGGPYALPPPGRRPRGNARPLRVAFEPANPLVGVSDMVGAVYQPVWSKARHQMGWNDSGTFEIHDSDTYGGSSFDAAWLVPDRRYYAIGGRCARR